MDHGIDRLPLFFLLLPLFLFSPSAQATSFGPISVTQQVTAAPYVLRGRIVGAAWVEEERRSRRPYTFWKLQITEQPKGESLGGEITIRQPGGELGGLGYHVAGSATFREGEDVFVNVKDTDEPSVKEVIGLASGKYTVEADENGQPQLRSGLGFVLKDSDQAVSPKAFSALVKRANEGQASEQDQNIFVNKTMAHERETNLKPPPPPTPSPAPPASHAPPPESSENATQESAPNTEKPEGTLWLLGLFGLAALAGVAYFLKR